MWCTPDREGAAWRKGSDVTEEPRCLPCLSVPLEKATNAVYILSAASLHQMRLEGTCGSENRPAAGGYAERGRSACRSVCKHGSSVQVQTI